MTTIVLLNLSLVIAALAALAAVCRIPYLFGRERVYEAKIEALYAFEDERQAA